MLQAAGLRRRQVTRISIKGIIDVGTAVSEQNNTFGAKIKKLKLKKRLRVTLQHDKLKLSGGFFPPSWS